MLSEVPFSAKLDLAGGMPLFETEAANAKSSKGQPNGEYLLTLEANVRNN